MKILILAAGKGTRMKPISEEMPKCMVPIAHKPLLRHIIDKFYQEGYNDIGVVISPGSTIPTLLEYENITYIVQEKPLGIANAVLCAKDFIGSDNFILYLGDNYYNGSIKEFAEYFRFSTEVAKLLITSVKDPTKYGVVEVKDFGRKYPIKKIYGVRRIVEKPRKTNVKTVSTGIYVFSPVIFSAIEGLKPSKRGEYEITDAVQTLIDNNYNVTAECTSGMWLDVGNPKALHRLEKLMQTHIDGKRLYLRDLRMSDVSDKYCEWMNDKDVTQYLESRFSKQSKADIKDFVKRVLADENSIFLAIIDKESEQHIGNIKLTMNRIHRTAEIGLVLGDKKFWGKGYATEVLKTIANYAFDDLNLFKVTAGVYKSNVGSCKAFEKAGFNVEGVQACQYIYNGHRTDKILFGMVRE